MSLGSGSEREEEIFRVGVYIKSEFQLIIKKNSTQKASVPPE